MSLIDTLAPTPERLARGEILAPEVNQQTQRRAYKALTPIEGLHRAGKISDACKDAGNKLTKHFLGSMGVDVSSGDGCIEPLEFPRSYHAAKLAEAQREINNRMVWWALMELVEERSTIEDVGRRIYGYNKRESAYGAGLATVSQGLHRLANMWGMTADEYHQSYPS